MFIIGCARSGTSIFGELLAAHPDVHYVWEAHSLWEGTAGEGPDGSHRLDESNATDEIVRTLRASLTAPSGLTLAEKNPRNTLRVPFLKTVFPDARIIHVVRDGRDVACSLIPGCGGPEWRHLKPPKWRSLMQDWEGIHRCGRIWRDVLEIALSDLESVPHLQIRYEDLLRTPAETAAAALAYLELPASPGVDDFLPRLSDSVGGSYHAEGQTAWFRPDHTRRIGRFRENLPPEKQEELTHLLGPLLDRLGYLQRP